MTLKQAPVALVTGSAKRIGSEIVRKLHAEGFNVILHYNGSQDLAETIANQLNAKRAASVTLLQFNLLNFDDYPSFVDRIISTYGQLDLLVNNASTFYPTPMDKIDSTQWDDLMGVNLKAPLLLSQALAPELKSHNGNIINIVDIHSERPLKDYPIYSVAKAGLRMLTKSLARELAPEIRVNGVSPGAIMWPEVEAYESMHEDIIQRTALKREGHPADIANCVWFLISAADYITGQIIAVDGGRTLSN